MAHVRRISRWTGPRWHCACCHCCQHEYPRSTAAANHRCSWDRTVLGSRIPPPRSASSRRNLELLRHCAHGPLLSAAASCMCRTGLLTSGCTANITTFDSSPMDAGIRTRVEACGRALCTSKLSAPDGAAGCWANSYARAWRATTRCKWFGGTGMRTRQEIPWYCRRVVL